MPDAVPNAVAPKTGSSEPAMDRRSARLSLPDSGQLAPGLTRRAVFLGLTLVGVVAALTPYNDLVVRNSPLIGNHLPIAVVAVLAFLVLAVNPLLSLFGRRPFAPGELIVILTLMLVGSAAPSSGLMRYLEPMILSPGWIVRDFPWLRDIAALMPHWLSPVKDPASPVVSNYWLGVDPLRGGHVPVVDFLLPALFWSIFIAAMMGCGLFLAAIFRRQWVHHERLTFPLATIPLELMAAPEPGRWYNRLWRNPILWVGVAVPAGVYFLAGLHAQWPAIPTIDLQFNISDAFQQRPWNALPTYVTNSRLFLSVVGITFFVPSEIALSLWLFLIMESSARVLFASTSIDVGAHATTRSMGTYVGYFIGLLWLARGHLRHVLVSAWRGTPREEGDPLTYRTMIVGLSLCIAAAWAWLTIAGMTGWVAAILLALGLMLMFLMARIVAETGLFFVGPAWWPRDFLNALLGPKAVNTATYYWGQVVSGVWFADLRETLLPYAANAMRMGQELREEERPRWFRRLAVALFISIVVSAVVQHWVSYTYGRTALGDQYAAYNMPYDALQGTYGFTHVASDTSIGRAWGQFGVGALMVAILMVGRVMFVSWPLHPLGLVLMNSGPLQQVWFSIFVGWAVKSLLLKYGGAGAYRRARPFFIGLIVGEMLSAAAWVFIGLISHGAVKFAFLPS